MKKITVHKCNKKEKGISAIALIVAILLLGSIGYIMSSLMSRSQESIPRTLDSTRAFYIAQGGVKYVGNYLNGQSNWISLTNPPISVTLGSGNFMVSYSPVDAYHLTATITGNSGTAHRAITVSYKRSGFAVRSQGGISMGNNADLVCDPSQPSNTCTNTNINTCPCIQQNVSSATMPPFSFPPPTTPLLPGLASGSPPGSCTIYSSETIPQGTYYCPSGMTVGNNVTITLSGAVTIYTTTFNLNNNVRFNDAGSAADLLIMAKGNVTLSNNDVFKGAIYAPGYDISIPNNVTFTGFVAGGRPGVWDTVDINNNATFDVSAGSNTGNSPPGADAGSAVTLTDWQG